MTEYYKDPSATVYYDPELDTLILKYTDKVMNDEHFITINTAVLNAFKTLNTRKFIADIRKMGIISIKSQQWVVENLLPGMIRHLKDKRLFHAQLLDPGEVFSKVSAANIKNNAKKVDEGFDVVQFTDEEEMRLHLKDFQ